MAEENLKFYNLIIHLVKNDKLYEENAAVKNIWQKNDNTFFDIYFYRNRKSYVFDSAFIHDIFDLTTEKYYGSPAAFIKDFQCEEELSPLPLEAESSLIDAKLFEPLKTDLIIMLFMAACGAPLSPIKEKILCDYITSRIPSAKTLSQQYLKAYLQRLTPSEDDFYTALRGLQTKSPNSVEDLARDTVKLCLSDGRLHYSEKYYLAEIFQILREQGVNPDVGL